MAAAAAAAPVSREEFEEFKVMFEFYRWWGRMSKEEELRTQELSAYYEKQGVQWSDSKSKLIPIPMWVVRRVVQWSECSFKQAKKICMFYNHPSGRGCIKKEGQAQCGYIHKCIFCESEKHGLYFCKPSGQYICPKLRAWEKEVEDFTKRYGPPDDEALKALAKQPLKQRRQPAAHPSRRVNLFESIASSDSDVYELKTSESDENEPAEEAAEMAEPFIAVGHVDLSYDSSKEPGDSDSDGRAAPNFNKQPVQRDVPPPGLERQELLEEVSDTGGAPHSTELLSEEHKLRKKLGLQFLGDRNAFQNPSELVRFLQENNLTDDLRVYRNMVACKNRSSQHSDNDGVAHPSARPAELGLQERTWPQDLLISDLHRSGTRKSKLLLELLCLRVRFVPGAITRPSDIYRIFAQRVCHGVSVRDVLAFRDRYFAIAFSTPEDVQKVMSESTSLGDLVQDLQHYRAQPTRRDNTVWFFNFLMRKVSLDDLQDTLETYGEVLNVHPINYHSSENDIVMNGWVEFREHSSMQQLIEDVNKDPFFYTPTKKEYTVLRFCGTMISIMRDTKGSGQGSAHPQGTADWLDTPGAPAASNERHPGVQALPPPLPAAPMANGERPTAQTPLPPPAPPAGGGEPAAQTLLRPPAPPAGGGEPAAQIPLRPPAPPAGGGERTLGTPPPLVKLAPGPVRPLVKLVPPLPPSASEWQPVVQAVSKPPPPLLAKALPADWPTPAPVRELLVVEQPPLPPPASMAQLVAPAAPLQEFPVEQRPVPPPAPPLTTVTASVAVPPPPPPQRELPLRAEQQSVADLLDQLEDKVAGIRPVLEKAKLINLSNGLGYITRLLDWVSDNEAAELEELERHSQQITNFMDLKALPAERFHKALQQALQAA